MRTVQINEFVTEPEDFDWLVEGLLADTGWTLLYGQPGLGKSTFALQLCAALRNGTPFLGRTVKKRLEFVYVQADGSSAEWRGICKRVAPECMGKSIVEVPTYALDNPQYLDYIASAIDYIKPGFVVYDSLYNLTAADINTPRILLSVNQMRQAALGSSIPWMLIHHPTKCDPSNPAGSGSLIANCSNDWSLTRQRLAIRKGRLVKDKEIKVQQDEHNLWHPYVREDTLNGNGITYGAQFRRN